MPSIARGGTRHHRAECTAHVRHDVVGQGHAEIRDFARGLIEPLARVGELALQLGLGLRGVVSDSCPLGCADPSVAASASSAASVSEANVMTHGLNAPTWTCVQKVTPPSAYRTFTSESISSTRSRHRRRVCSSFSPLSGASDSWKSSH